ncbi:MAG: hypothetical protein FIA97_09960 [Methylococcaceae bacterium]|nr:hypothetical protein [Methylococcaceae bacterium]
MTTANKFLLGVLTSALAAPLPAAEQPDEILKVKKSTFVNLVDLLVQRGVLKQHEGKGLVKAAEDEAAEVESAQKISKDDHPKASGDDAGSKPGKSMHVSYVPEIVKKEIREQVRAELRADVAKDVQAKAKEEKWGIPAALPDWVGRIQPYFDMRLRLADEFYDANNAQAYDWAYINEVGSLHAATAVKHAGRGYLNTRTDRLRLRERFRVGFDAQITDHIKGGFRFATSNMYNPVSNDQTLGNTGQSYQFAIDRSFLQYDFVDGKGRDWFSVYGGRFANPFVSTDVVYDPDLSFEGLASTFRWRFNQSVPAVKNYKASSPTARFGINQGTQTPDTLFATLGVFPIEEVNFSSSDKWMFGGQLGGDWLVFDDQRLTVAASYYDFHNIRARRNPIVITPNSLTTTHAYDWTAPQFIQKGNSLVAINDTGNQPVDCPDADVCRVGLASDFSVFNVTATYDYAGFAPTHMLFTADFAKNLGFNQQRIAREFHDNITPKTNAFQFRVDVGHPEVRHFNDWNLYLAYRYMERDAVLDAFTDSVFHQGGTNAKGWVAGVQYGLARNTWLNLRWFSTGTITGPRYDIDTVNLDLNARF